MSLCISSSALNELNYIGIDSNERKEDLCSLFEFTSLNHFYQARK